MHIYKSERKHFQHRAHAKCEHGTHKNHTVHTRTHTMAHYNKDATAL